jgi:predicted RNase H-like HicB family nuclease
VIAFRKGGAMVQHLKIVVERHPDTFVAYPLGIEGVVVGQGDTAEEALENVKSAIAFHLKSFGPSAINSEAPVLDAFVTDTAIAV